MIVNSAFYENAKAVVCLSKMHREIFERNLELDNLRNINCSLFSDKKIEIRTISEVIILEVCNFVFFSISIEIVAAIAFSKVSTLEVTKQIPRISKA